MSFLSETVGPFIALCCNALCAGVCLDFLSIRHVCPERCAALCCLRNPKDDEDHEDPEADERRPLLSSQKNQSTRSQAQSQSDQQQQSNAITQPSARPPMTPSPFPRVEIPTAASTTDEPDSASTPKATFAQVAANSHASAQKPTFAQVAAKPSSPADSPSQAKKPSFAEVASRSPVDSQSQSTRLEAADSGDTGRSKPSFADVAAEAPSSESNAVKQD